MCISNATQKYSPSFHLTKHVNLVSMLKPIWAWQADTVTSLFLSLYVWGIFTSAHSCRQSVVSLICSSWSLLVSSDRTYDQFARCGHRKAERCKNNSGAKYFSHVCYVNAYIQHIANVYADVSFLYFHKSKWYNYCCYKTSTETDIIMRPLYSVTA